VARREAMAPTVTVIRQLCDAIEVMSARQPAVPSKGMDELAAEVESYRSKSKWTEPVQGAHTFEP
jgi:hypothetical protein